MRFRRRKPRVVWFPTPGTPYSTNAPGQAEAPEPYLNSGAVEISLQTTVDNTPVTVSAPLVLDQSPEETAVGATLATVQRFGLNQVNQFGYRLRRIVGDIFIGIAETNSQATVAGGVLLEAGIIVRRVDSNGLAAVNADAQDVGNIANETDPWVWRKNWALSGRVANPQNNLVFEAINNFPRSNAFSMGSAPHIKLDQKTARVLGPEERLFLTLTAWTLPLDKLALTTDNNSNFQVYFLMPYRVLGTVRTTSGNRRNASR